MKKIAVLMIVALGMVCTRAVADEYVFSVDGKYTATAPRTLPSNGRNFETGNVVSNLSVQTAETLVKCGWYKVIVPSY